MSGVAIGIDLGTTFSCVAIYREKQGPEIIPIEYGERLLPSVVYFDPTTGDVLVGKNAIDEIPECPSNGLYDAKRILGRKYNDEYISKLTKNIGLPFSIVRGEDGQAAFQVKIGDSNVIKTPEEVSAEILKYIKNIACNYLGEKVTEAVISVPAYFSNAQRSSTRKAAELAGLQVLKLITEPTAAAIHYVSDREKNNINILVFDFGGGTLDVSIIEVKNKQFQVKAVYGDTFLGGRDIDEILFNYFYTKFPPDQIANQRRKETYIRRLRGGCVVLKQKLSSVEEAKCTISSCFGREEELRLCMSRNEFEKLANDIFQQALDIVKLALEDSGIPKSQIDEVVLVGGTTKIPFIHEMMKSCFGNDKIRTNVHPDEAVAAGASIQASFLKSGLTELENYKVTEITPLSLGIETEYNLMVKFISKHTALPCRISHKFSTCDNNQTAINIKIFEGERKNTIYNNMLGEFEINGLPRKRAGDLEIHVIFELDDNGILKVTANEKSTKKSRNLSVTMGQFRLSERKVRLSLEEARKNKHVDDTFEKFVLFRCKVEEICKRIQYDLNKITSSTDRESVEKACFEFLLFNTLLNFTEIEKLEGRFAVFKNSVEDILGKNCMLEICWKLDDGLEDFDNSMLKVLSLIKRMK